jgi:hypothetical protein
VRESRKLDGTIRTNQNLDSLKRRNDQTLRRSGTHTRQDRETLGHGDLVPIGIDLPPAVVGGKLERSLGGLEHERGDEASVETTDTEEGKKARGRDQSRVEETDGGSESVAMRGERRVDVRVSGSRSRWRL